MKSSKQKKNNWPMQYILGGIGITAMVVLLTYGLQHAGPDNSSFDEQAGTEEPRIVAEAWEEIAEDTPSAPAGGELIWVNEDFDDEIQGPLREGVDEQDPVTDEPVAEPMSYAEAESLYKTRDYSAAAAGFASYITTQPENPWGHYMLGLCSWKAGDLPVAEAALNEALTIKPDLIKAQYNLCRVLMARERHEEALAGLEASAGAGARVDVVQRLRGRALHNLGRREEALAAYRLALALNPTDAWALGNMGLILIEDTRFDEALGALALAVELDGEVPCFRNNLGIVLENLNFKAAAAESFAAGLALDSAYEKAALNLARVELLVQNDTSPELDLAQVARAYAATLAALESVPAQAEGGEELENTGDEGEAIEPNDAAAVEDKAGEDEHTEIAGVSLEF